METPPPDDHSFAPTNSKLITAYLRRRVAGEPLPSAAAAYFHDTDIYAAEPAALTAGLQPVPARKGEGSSWLFFTPVKTKSRTDSRRSRRVGGGVGTWHSEHKPEAVVDDDGNSVGHRQLFSYKDKNGKRTGWSMWEFGAEDQEGGEALLVLCKIHQGHAGSRRADGSAARSARKRKCTGDDVDNIAKMAPAPVKRRLFSPPAPAPPAASEDEIGAPSESTRTEAEPWEDKIDASLMLDAIPIFRDTTEASKDTPRSVMSFWEEEPCLLQQGKINTTTTSVRSFSPRPDAPHENITSTTVERPATASLLIPEPEAIPSSRTETEVPEDAPRSVMIFWDEAYPPQPDMMSETSTSPGSFSPEADTSHENVISCTMESPATFLIPEPQAFQGETATFDCGFQMDGRAPPAPEYGYDGSFTDCTTGRDVLGVPPPAPGAEISGSWTGHDMAPSYCFPTYGERGAGASGSSSGYDTTASCSGGISRFAGVQYGCGLPSTNFLPSAAPSWWCGRPSLWNC